MYEEGYHPRRQRIMDRIDTQVDNRRIHLEEYLKPNGEPLTPARINTRLDEYRARLEKKARKRGQLRGDIYLFAVMPIAFLNRNVPNGFDWRHKIVDSEPVVRKMEEYLLLKHTNRAGTKVLFMLAGKPVKGNRSEGVMRAEITQWKDALEGWGFDWEDRMTPAQYKTRLLSAAYNDGELDV